ncbi:MAG TPA: DMT family transporter [Acetobacteraceae bacterium]|nr:DMT family transporter [Acetobacteraceae bacterium]
MDTGTLASAPPPPARLSLARARRRAVLLVLGAAAVFSVAGAFVKALDGAIPLAQVVFCRNLFCLPVLLPLLLREGGAAALRMRKPWMHAWRIAAGLLGMCCTFYGYVALPFATVTALGFTMPLFLTLLSAPLLGERVGPRRGGAVLAGFGGVLLMTNPAEQHEGKAFAVALVLLGALGWALAMIAIRRMGEAGERGVTIVFWFAAGAAAVSGAACVPVWVAPTATQWVLLAGIGLVSAAAQVMMTEGYRRGEATLLAPFEYSAIIWTTFAGALVWAELPDGWDLAGIAVLVASGLYIWRREVALGPRR